jgi:hypothetical protein
MTTHSLRMNPMLEVGCWTLEHRLQHPTSNIQHRPQDTKDAAR